MGPPTPSPAPSTPGMCGKRRTKTGKRKHIADPVDRGGIANSTGTGGAGPGAAGTEMGAGAGVGTETGVGPGTVSGPGPGPGTALALTLASPRTPAEHTAQHAAERDELQRVLAQYRQIEAELKAEGRSKPDMTAYSRTREHYSPARQPRWGHVPGTQVGDRLVGRGEVAITAG